MDRKGSARRSGLCRILPDLALPIWSCPWALPTLEECLQRISILLCLFASFPQDRLTWNNNGGFFSFNPGVRSDVLDVCGLGLVYWKLVLAQVAALDCRNYWSQG